MESMKSHDLAKLLLQYPNKMIYNQGDGTLEQIKGIDFGLSNIITIANGIDIDYESFVDKDHCEIVLIDCDGVLLQWGSRLVDYANAKGIDVDTSKTDREVYTVAEEVFMTDFETANELINDYHFNMLDRLYPYTDSHCINESNRRFVVVTAIGTDPELIKLRWKNLQKYFRGSVVNLLCCEPNESKLHLFEKAKELYGDRVVAYIDDLSHHLTDCKKVFNIPCYNIIRGDAVATTGDWITINKLNEVSEIVS